MKEESFGIPLFTSLTIHGLVLLVASSIVHSNRPLPDFLRVSLIELPAVSEEKKPAPLAKPPENKPTEIKPILPTKTDATVIASAPRVEDGGSEASASNLFGKSENGVLPGTGSAGGGTSVAGLGRGAGAPGLPAQQPIFRTNREAKALQTARASYPAMALRNGVESDVTLRIEVDTQGNVTKAEILKSGGAGFDDEALKAVKQSRFEPAQKDGQNVAAEFTFVYRFRLQR
ncbi:MAG: energy transducer TonB [Deltaproteobacteria bacterium]|nr:energy transducer TonB [Deltaproteobacteria bacterium]